MNEIFSLDNISIFSKKKKIEKTLFNYECIPFQNSLMENIKKKDKTTKVLGYLHCAPWPLQTDLIFRDFLKKLEKIILYLYV